MSTFRKYLLSAFAAITVSLTLANVTAMAYCPPVDDTSEYRCENTGEDSCYCYYSCTCKVDTQACYAALFENGYSLIRETE